MTGPHREQAHGVSLGRRFFSVPTLLSFGVAGALVFLLATRLDLDWGATWNTVRGMNPWLYLVGLLLYYLSFGFRGARWRMLARNAGVQSLPGARLPSVLACSRLIVIGWFVNSIVGFRLGDAYRAYAFSEESRGGFSWSLGMVLAERGLDMAIVLGLLAVSAVFLTTIGDSRASAYVVVAAFAMTFGFAGIIVLMRGLGGRLARFLPGRLEEAYHRFHQGTLGSFKQLPVLVLLGLVGWILEIGRLFFVIQALDLSVPFPLIPVVALGHAILSTVPTPGGVGAVEPGVTGLLLISLERSDAVSVALVDRSITYASVIVIGGLVFLLRHVALARQRRRRPMATGRPAE
jgi:uncharacterized protein (TIRG00374 family)